MFLITLLFIVSKLAYKLDKSKGSCAVLDLGGEIGWLANISAWTKGDCHVLPYLSCCRLFQKPIAG